MPSRPPRPGSDKPFPNPKGVKTNPSVSDDQSQSMTENASRQYQTQQIMTASPAMLVFMLFDKAISSLNMAVRAIAANDVQERWRNNNRAIEVISHLQRTLNMELGGEVAENLDRLYTFMLKQLSTVDKNNDPKPAEDVIKLLEPLRESWRDLANQGDKPAREAAKARAAADAKATADAKAAADAKTANGGNENQPGPEAPGENQDQGPGTPEGPDTPKAHVRVSVSA